MQITDLTAYYSDLLAYQYRGRPNASRTMALLTKQAVADLFVQQLTTCYDIDQAVGAQLDILGKYVGVARNIGAVIARPYFGLWDYAGYATLAPDKYQGTWVPSTNSPALPAAAGGNTGWWYVIEQAGTSAAPIVETFAAGDAILSDGAVWSKVTVATQNNNGLTEYEDISVNRNGVFYDYAFLSNQNSDLTDAEYRTVLKLKIILNANDGTLATIMDYLWTFFGSDISLIDSADMHFTYTVVSTVPLSQQLLELYLPKPMGVGITVNIISPLPDAGVEITTEGGLDLTTEGGSTIIT